MNGVEFIGRVGVMLYPKQAMIPYSGHLQRKRNQFY